MKTVYSRWAKMRKQFILFVILSLLTLIASGPMTFAVSASISKAYNSSEKFIDGEIVSLVNPKTNVVALSDYHNQSSMIGIVEGENQGLVSIDPNLSSVQVASYGDVEAIVSNLNGFISPGDKIALSPISGIGMKSNGTSQIIGIAESSFNSSSKYISESIQTTSGKKIITRVGYVRLLIMIGSGQGNVSIIQRVQNFAQSLTGKPVSYTRLIVALIIAALGIVSVVTLIYSGVDGTLISFGRNPLAKDNFFKVLKNISIISVLIIILTLILVYILIY